jgi:DNA-binding NarL/FixJ family response regulator
MKRILIADPNANTRKALALLLSRKMGLSGIDEVGDADALIRVLADCPPAILLLDWQLYGAPAPETCRLLRKAYPALHIILLSVNAEDRQIAQEAGATFIHKGASPDDVLGAIEQVLKNKQNHGNAF